MIKIVLDINSKERLAKIIEDLIGNRTQAQFAAVLGLAQSTLNNYLKKKITTPQIDHLEAIANYAGMLPEELIAHLYGRSLEIEKMSTEQLFELQDRINKVLRARL